MQEGRFHMINPQYLNKHDARNVSSKRKVKIGKKRVAIYVRVSTQHEMQINALSNQKQWAIELAQDHKDWIFNTDKDLFVDEGISGTLFENRPQFSEMINKAKSGVYYLIIVREVCRFMRNAKLTLNLVDKLLEYDVEVYFVNDGIWSRNEEDYFKLTIMAQYAEQESRKISERVFSGQAIARENGVLMGNGNILGYNLVKGDKSADTTYVINEEQAQIVREIYEMALKGIGMKKIRHYLEDKGYKTSCGSEKWYESTIERILRRRTYMGELEHFQSVTEDPLTHERVKVPKEQRISKKMEYPKIIEPDLWYAVQRSIDSRVNHDFKPGNKNGINGKVENKDIYCRKTRCGCGRRLRKDVETKNNTATYYCYQVIEDGSQSIRLERSHILNDNCSVVGIRDWKLDLFTWKVFNYLECNIPFVKVKLMSIIERSFVGITDSGYSVGDIMKLDKEIEQLNARNENLLNLLEEGIIDKEVYKARKGNNDTELAKKAVLKKNLEAMQFNDEQKQKTIASVKSFVDKALEFPKVGMKSVKVPDILIETYVNSIKACANGVFEYNIRVNPDIEVNRPVIPDDEFNPFVHPAKRFLDNSNSSLIAEFTIDYDQAKEYANKVRRKVKRVHFQEPVTIRIYADL